MSTLLNNVIENVKPAFWCDGGSEETNEDYFERIQNAGFCEQEAVGMCYNDCKDCPFGRNTNL